MSIPRPTGFGIKAFLFFGVLLGALLAAPYSNLFFLMVAFLAVLGLSNLLFAVGNLRGVRAEVEAGEPSPTGAGGTVRLAARGRWPRPGVGLELGLEGHGRVRLPVGADEEQAVRLPAFPRGVYPIRSARLFSTWPLGLVRVLRTAEPRGDVVVYPAPYARAPDAAGGGTGGDELCGAIAVGEGFAQPSGVREYRAGDEIRRVHWKASARRGELVVKEWEDGGGGGLEVLLDRRAGEEEFERALSILTTVALEARDRKEVLKVLSQGFSGSFGPGHGKTNDLLRFLAGAALLPPNGPAPPPVSPGTLRLPDRGGRP